MWGAGWSTTSWVTGDPSWVRRRAWAAREAARSLVKQRYQLRDAADLARREAEATLHALRETIRQPSRRVGWSAAGPTDGASGRRSSVRWDRGGVGSHRPTVRDWWRKERPCSPSTGGRSCSARGTKLERLRTNHRETGGCWRGGQAMIVDCVGLAWSSRGFQRASEQPNLNMQARGRSPTQPASHHEHDAADRHHALWLQHALDAKHRDEAPHTNCGDGTDDDEGEDYAQGKVHGRALAILRPFPHRVETYESSRPRPRDRLTRVRLGRRLTPWDVPGR